MTRRLDHPTRQSIAKKMREGVRPDVLAREYGVTVRTVYRCAQFMRQIQIERGSRTETVVWRSTSSDHSPDDAKPLQDRWSKSANDNPPEPRNPFSLTDDAGRGRSGPSPSLGSGKGGNGNNGSGGNSGGSGGGSNGT